MSAGIGYFRIEFYKGDGSADVDAAKRAYDWCMENYDWFKDGDGSNAPFSLVENSFAGRDEYCGGLDIKNGDIPADIDWLADAAKEAKVERLVASIHEDYSETSYDSNSYTEKVWIDGEEKNEYKVYEFNSSTNPPYEMDSYSTLCHLDENSFRYLSGMFKNVKTGEIVLAGQLLSSNYFNEEYGEYTDEGPDPDSTRLCFSESDESVFVNLEDLNSINKQECVKAFISEVKAFMSNDFEISESDWTFEGFRGERRSFFEIYGSKTPTSPFMDCEDYAEKLDAEIDAKEDDEK